MPTTNPDHIAWAIKARARSQRLMLALFEFGVEHGYPSGTGAQKPEDLKTSVFSLMVGASFSLWRAAFLAEQPTRTWPEALKDASDLLDTVLRTNTILFGTEQKLQGWTAGYYLNNAKLRLLDTLSREVEVGLATDADLARVREIKLVWTDPREMWQRLCDEAEHIARRLGCSLRS